MKKVVLLSLVTSAMLLASDTPINPSLSLAYMNNILNTPSERFLQLEKSQKSLQAGADLLYSDSYLITNVTASYVYNNMVGVSLGVPLLSNSLTEESGIGDTMFALSFNAGNFGEENVYNNIFEIRYNGATGDETKGLGMGSSSISIDWDTSAKLSEDFEGFVSLMYTFYLDDVYGYKPGDEATDWIGIRHKCLLSDKIDTSFKLNWQTKYRSSRPLDYTYDVVDLTLEWSSDKLLKNVPLRTGVKLPLYETDGIKGEFAFFIGAGATF